VRADAAPKRPAAKVADVVMAMDLARAQIASAWMVAAPNVLTSKRISCSVNNQSHDGQSDRAGHFRFPRILGSAPRSTPQ
jgi:hypothetical protein